jgi:hypothetical protein
MSFEDEEKMMKMKMVTTKRCVVEDLGGVESIGKDVKKKGVEAYEEDRTRRGLHVAV